MQLYWSHWWALVVFLWHLEDLVCIVLCHLQAVTVLFLFSNLDSFYLFFYFLLFILFYYYFILYYFIIYFLLFIPFIFLLWLSKIRWTKVVSIDILVLFLIFRGNVFSFFLLRMMFIVGLSYMAFMLKFVPSTRGLPLWLNW